MAQKYLVRVLYRGFDDPAVPQSPVEELISPRSKPKHLPHISGCTDLVFVLDGRVIPANRPFQETAIRNNSLLLILKQNPNEPLPLDELNPLLLEKDFPSTNEGATLYGCPSAAEVAGLVPESMAQAFQEFKAVEL